MLKLYLEEEASQAKGYIVVLRAQITDVPFTRDVKSSFRADVFDSLGLSGNTVSFTVAGLSVIDAKYDIQTTESIENELQNILRRGGSVRSDLVEVI